MSAVIDMDDPLAATPPGPKDTPPSPRDPKDTPAAETPRKRNRKTGDAQLKLDLKEIEEKLAVLLETPGVPMAAAGDVWPAQHIEHRAAPLAKAIATACKDNPQLREKLLQLLRVGEGASLLIAAVAYIAPVAMYYGLVPAPPILKMQLQIPDRNTVRQASVMEQMRAYEQQMAAEDAQRAAQTVPSDDGPPHDPENPRSTPRAHDTAQASPPPAI